MEAAEHQVRQWLERVVVGMNLCPFAATPFRNGQVRIAVSRAATEVALLADLESELVLLDGTPAATIETTLLVVAAMLADFDAYNQFLDQVDALLRRGGWEGTYQVASFHPRYRFAGTKDEDAGNLTNRSPWPILHILREASIDEALAGCAEPETIPQDNIRKMRALTPEEIRDCFPWLPD
jgi:hypothetical protein